MQAQSTRTGKARPDFVITSGGLSTFLGECKRDVITIADAWTDLGRYFTGLPKLFYQGIPFIPTFVARGSKLQFGVLQMTGMVRIVLKE